MFHKMRQRIARLGIEAVQLYQQGQYEQAIGPATQACDLARRHLGEKHPDTAACLNNAGALYQAMGDYARAERLLKEALAVRRKVLGERHRDTLTTLNNLGTLYRAMGDYAEAEPLLEQALAVRREVLGDEDPDTISSINNVGALYHTMGDYARATPLYEEALAICRSVLPRNHPYTAGSINNLGTLCRDMGDYARAEPLLQEALAIRRKVLGERHPDTAACLNNLGDLYQAMGDYARAELHHQEALAILRGGLGPCHPDTAQSLHNLAELYRVKGDYGRAERHCQEALAIRRKVLAERHPHTAQSLYSLASLYHTMADYTQAERYYQEALAIFREVLGPQHPYSVTIFHALAVQYHGMGEYTRAEPLYKDALAIRRKVLGDRHPDNAVSLNNLACLLAASGRFSQALEHMQQAIAIDDHMIGQVFSIASEAQRMAYLTTLEGNSHAFLSLVMQHFTQDPAAVRAAMDLALRRKAIGAEALAAQRDAVLGGRYPALAPQMEALTALRRQMAEKRLRGPGPEGPEAHHRLLDEWDAEKERLEGELARQIPEMNLEQRLRAADRQAVAQVLPEGSALVEFVRFNVFDFSAVPARGEWQWKPARYLAFVLHAGEPDNVQMIDLGEAEIIDGKIAAFRASVTGQTERHSGRDLATLPVQSVSATSTREGLALRETLFNPLLPALGNCIRLFLAPDGDLTRVPFEVLPTDAGRRLIDDYHISYLGVGRDVLRFGAQTTIQPTEPLVAADPDFDLGGRRVRARPTPPGRRSRDLDWSDIHFGRLPGTRVEGEHIAAMLGVKSWLGGAVLEARLKTRCSPRIVHLATHGFFLADQKRDPNQELRDLGVLALQAEGAMGRLSAAGLENPLLRSGLALAGANTWLKKGTPPPEAEDGILTGEDVSGLDMLATELVVLSACETGLGEVQVGEGVFGLRRAFVLAGAKTLVMSLWKVPDAETQELMEDFYRRLVGGRGRSERRLVDGRGRSEALRAAQLAMKVKHPDPLYWGAFICQGDPGPLLRVEGVQAAAAPAAPEQEGAVTEQAPEPRPQTPPRERARRQPPPPKPRVERPARARPEQKRARRESTAARKTTGKTPRREAGTPALDELLAMLQEVGSKRPASKKRPNGALHDEAAALGKLTAMLGESLSKKPRRKKASWWQFWRRG